MTTTPDTPAAYATRLLSAVNAAMRSAASITGISGAGGMLGALDEKRACAWQEYGWPDHLEFDNFKHLYDRQGVAYGVVNILAGKCWEDSPRVIEGEPEEIAQPATPWEKTVTAILRKSRFWKAYSEADRMRVVGGWSAILLQMSDDAEQTGWEKPLQGTPRLLKATPAWAGQLKPNVDPKGAVTSWAYQEGCPTSVDGTALRNLTVHPDRIILVGNWRTGVSMLRAPYNAFVNLEKISGGSGESFLKNAARQLHLNFDKDTDLNGIAQAYGVKPEELQEVFNETAKRINRGNDMLLATQGAQVGTLTTSVPDPKAHAEMNTSEIAAAFQMPVKVIVGMQTGERASTEDLKDLNRRCQGRRIHVLTFDTDDAIEHLIRIRVLTEPTQGFHIYWSDLTEGTQSEKLASALTMADINAKTAGTGEAPPFSSDEIREVAGYEAREDAAGAPPTEQLSAAEEAARRLSEAEAAATGGA